MRPIHFWFFFFLIMGFCGHPSCVGQRHSHTKLNLHGWCSSSFSLFGGLLVSAIIISPSKSSSSFCFLKMISQPNKNTFFLLCWWWPHHSALHVKNLEPIYFFSPLSPYPKLLWSKLKVCVLLFTVQSFILNAIMLPSHLPFLYSDSVHVSVRQIILGF